ncbi:uncharacterized protein LOC122025322 [Zingiber officinale]|uniref:Transmembrane protein n=1 Tax=Zingiber officinale TaxID=94328 RepID=A0A8J5K785_ZINOF|nr:uncharacterized protein LOC122025322 [Zingiber officinale]KAG6476459.1 hypothetical protein ZIOFF_065701 [Zingiber officinale]
MTIQLTFLLSLLLLSLIFAEEHPKKLRSSSPHGLFFENPMPFPPSAYDFFHPNANGAIPATAPLSSLYPGKTSSRARADAVVATSFFSVPSSHHAIGIAAAGVAALVVGLGLVVLVVMITSFFIIKCRAETKKTNSTNVA